MTEDRANLDSFSVPPTAGEMYRDVEDTELIRKARAGDDEAFGEIVRRHQGRLRAFASRYLSDPNDVFEMVQDAFLDAYNHLERFDVSRDFGPWVRAICKNRILNLFRARRRKRNVNLQLIDDAIVDRIADEAEEDDEAAELRVEALRYCVQQLRKPQLKLVELRYYAGVAVKEIADSFNQSAASISMRLMRIRSKLRKCMEKRLEYLNT